MKRLLLLLAGLAAAISSPPRTPALAGTPSEAVARQLDKASACRRRLRWSCVLKAADEALARLAGGEPQASARLEALGLRAEALAQLGRSDEAVAAFQLIGGLSPEWRPRHDAAPEARQAYDKARGQTLDVRLPRQLELPPLTTKPTPALDEQLPEPLLYAPPELEGVEERAGPAHWHVGVGGGIMLLGGASADRYDPGVGAVLDLIYRFDDTWGLWVQGMLTIHELSDGVRAEPGYSRGLTSASGAVGGRAGFPIIEQLEITAGLAVGGGTFGVKDLGEQPALALHGALGVRYLATKQLGVRLEVSPLVFVPLDGGDVGPAASIGVVARAEIRF